MSRVILLVTVIFFSCVSLAAAQDTATPPYIVVTVILVYPSATPSPTATDGPTPTPTLTPTATPNTSSSYYTESGEDIVIRREVTPGDAAQVGLLVVIAGLLLSVVIRDVLGGRK